MKSMSNDVGLNHKSKFGTKSLVLTAMFTALLCVMSQITIPTQPVPFTLSLLAVFMAGAIMPTRLATLSTIVYILLGVFGLPVFANMRGGIGVLFDKTGGYLIAYPLMAGLISLFRTRLRKHIVMALSIGMGIALLLCYLLGTIWFSKVTGIDFGKSLVLCVYPYIPFDILKLILAISFSMVIRKAASRYIDI